MPHGVLIHHRLPPLLSKFVIEEWPWSFGCAELVFKPGGNLELNATLIMLKKKCGAI